MEKGASNRLLYISIFFLTIALIFFSFFQFIEGQSREEKSNISSRIGSMLVSKNIISKDIKREIENMVQETNNIAEVQIYDIKNIDANSAQFWDYIDRAKPDYEYSKGLWLPEQLFIDRLSSGNSVGEQSWYVTIEGRSVHAFSVLGLLLGITFSGLLFFIWAIRIVYRRKRVSTI
ncbi:hypothetical protein ABET51_15705 [Metabacillus fastidiosus]|uniref:hypothetical protein n=1 Tax=Metabacillus fastidiosus TaxID=1458 RepID=UPI002E1D364A|nr:hypothetical protein [Metabacillus fastidiosus]